jgi:PmbA protein
VHSLRIEVKDGRPEGVKRTEETSAALRVLVDGKREGFAFTTAPDGTGFTDMVNDAIDAARLLLPSGDNCFSSSEIIGPGIGLYDPDGLEIPFENKMLLAAEIEAAVLDADARIEQAHKPAFGQQQRITAIASGGHTWSYEDSVFSLSVQAVARSEEESQSGFDFMASRRYSDLSANQVGRNAALEAVQLLGGMSPETGTFPALFPPKAALDLLEALITSFSAEEMQKGRSRLVAKRGEKLFSDILTLVDDGTMPWRTGSVPFDDERVPPVPRRLIDRGVINGCMHTLKTAAKWSEEPTGSAERASLASAPSPAPSNLYILEGDGPIDKAIPSGPCLRIGSLMGAHMIDRVSGDFSLGATGYILNDGEPVRPFRNGTVSGNLFDLMAALVAVGDDLTFYGSLGSPTLLFDSIIVSGS